MLLTSTFLRELLNYDPVTGLFSWRNRTPAMFCNTKHSAAHECARWNSRYGGKPAGKINKNKYVDIKINGSLHLAHRLAWLWMTGEWPTCQVDHINGDRSDNRLVNLRAATNAQNCANRRIRRDNRSGLKGVYFHNQSGKFRAEICVNGRSKTIGSFDTASAAHAAYCGAAQKHFGEFARTE